MSTDALGLRATVEALVAASVLDENLPPVVYLRTAWSVDAGVDDDPDALWTIGAVAAIARSLLGDATAYVAPWAGGWAIWPSKAAVTIPVLVIGSTEGQAWLAVLRARVP